MAAAPSLEKMMSGLIVVMLNVHAGAASCAARQDEFVRVAIAMTGVEPACPAKARCKPERRLRDLVAMQNQLNVPVDIHSRCPAHHGVELCPGFFVRQEA